ncbi:helix-turn-helix domain-containing protein [Acetivibrio mesophilus]|uniref:Helix-turn-helix domain-containing protein n=1 Tax=Acetivibrio mesophilus TaxID=2487273 RepID=A0A4Q0I8D5_9FIRM|nr:helix-turn-helix transcriptional regulator [Acetivibrio mesophilus]RXE60653.1 helix-turn-helix domain-containing protein [Acetivibrio mesophilus]
MDQTKIGRFIAQERKRKNLTQKQLAELLGISDKTISKWERGNGFPEVSLLLPLCRQLDISLNELLTGERVSEEEYRKKAEENMVNLVREAQESKKKIILSAMVAGLTIIAAVPMFVIAGTIQMENWIRVLLIVIGIFVVTGGIAIACILDREAGAFECPECGERFVPDMKAYVMGPHTFTKRKLVCPNCGAHKYCKHVLTR